MIQEVNGLEACPFCGSDDVDSRSPYGMRHIGNCGSCGRDFHVIEK